MRKLFPAWLALLALFGALAFFTRSDAQQTNPFVQAGSSVFTRTASNGGTAVSLKAGVAGTVIFPTKLMISNQSTTATHTVQILSSTGAVVLLEFQLGSQSCFILDGTGEVQTASGDALQMKFTDGTGAAGDVIATGFVVQR